MAKPLVAISEAWNVILAPYNWQAGCGVNASSAQERRLRGNQIARAAMILMLTLLPVRANATLTVVPGLTVHNKCPYDIGIAVRYKDSRGNWATAPFTNIRGREQKNAVISTDNSIIYYYAESSNGNRWYGDHNVNVDGKTYPMKKKQLTLDEIRNRYYLALTCNN